MSSTNGVDLQEYINKCKLLITDYSSVFFDFAYLEKPILFYQFDEEQFNKQHYEKGYFDYKRDGFGYVCDNEQLLNEKISLLINSNFSNEPIFIERRNNFFTLSNNENCKRIVDKILEL